MCIVAVESVTKCMQRNLRPTKNFNRSYLHGMHKLFKMDRQLSCAAAKLKLYTDMRDEIIYKYNVFDEKKSNTPNLNAREKTQNVFRIYIWKSHMHFACSLAMSLWSAYPCTTETVRAETLTQISLLKESKNLLIIRARIYTYYR